MSAPPGYDGGSLLPSPPTDPTIHVMRGGYIIGGDSDQPMIQSNTSSASNTPAPTSNAPTPASNTPAPVASNAPASADLEKLKNKKEEDENIKFSEEQKEILKKYGLGEGGPIANEIDIPTKKLFLEQIQNPICKNGTGDGIIFNKDCSAIIPVLRALIQKEIERANAQISEMFQKTSGIYETIDLDKTSEEAGKLLSALRSKLDTNAPGLMENLATSKAIETTIVTNLDKSELIKLKQKINEQVKELAAKKAIQQSQPAVLKKGIRPGSVANVLPSEKVEFLKPKKNFVNRLENKWWKYSRTQKAPRPGSVANKSSNSRSNIIQEKPIQQFMREFNYCMSICGWATGFIDIIIFNCGQ
jgi:hypothetical protein